ncbi:hypothetical protein BgAZ_107540 [Babesia gibsoni]|uniref:Uncharacterized protein n=1 Tax=Babesia gibsoni TaxID=33632 RepID=A0AAD8PG56_BABGI|nr:hypothetical protein BgAZ_107540 [Babesia gibsoni]
MWKQWLGSIGPMLKRHLTDENRSKIAILGAGCSYVYLNGVWLYVSMQSDKSPNRDTLVGPVPQLFIGDILSHYSPYLLPSYVKGNCLSEAERLINSESTELRERIMTYLTLNKILRNPVCARSVFCGSRDYGPILKDIISPKELPVSVSKDDASNKEEPELLFNIKISCLEHYLEATPQEARNIDYEDMVALMKLSYRYPTTNCKEKISKVLRLFLENENNCVSVARKEFEIFQTCSLINEDASKMSDLILKFLYSTRSPGLWLMAMLNENHGTAVNNAISIENINRAVNSSGMVLAPLSVTKWRPDGFQRFIAAVEISYAYAFLRNLISRSVPGTESGPRFKVALMDGLRTTRGVLIYHAIFLLQNKIIHSERYFHNDSFMLPMSVVICSTSWMALSALTITHRYFLLPTLIHKLFT